MAAKTFAFLVLFMAAFALIASEVAARDLAENTDATKPNEVTDQYGGRGGGYGGGRGGGYGGGRGGGYGGGRGGYGGGHGGYGGGGHGGYGGGHGGNGGGYGGGHGGGCPYGRCGYRCCYFAGENTDGNVEAQPQN